LAVISVELDFVEQAAKVIAGFPEVAHSCLRKNHLNTWFTTIAVDEERIEGVLGQIRLPLSLGSSQVLDLPMKRVFKLDSWFTLLS